MNRTLARFIELTRNADGILAAGRDDLAKLFGRMGFTTGAEIGVWKGDFSKRLCDRIPGLQLTCVDPWRQYPGYQEAKNDQARLDAAFQTACDQLVPYGCVILRCESVAGAKTINDGSLDFVYIDGNHADAFVRQDLAAWTPKVRPGGIVAGHDYVPAKHKNKHLEVKAAVDAFTAARHLAVHVLGADKSPSFFFQVPDA